MWYLADIMHNDISVANMMFVRGPYPRRGMLIDVEYSVDLLKERLQEYKKNAEERHELHKSRLIEAMIAKLNNKPKGKGKAKAKAKSKPKAKNAQPAKLAPAQGETAQDLLQLENIQMHNELVLNRGMRTVSASLLDF